ncbi:MAG TPA: hypothetical protein VL832_30035, partial [Puia sp.]|nr:hypothetical protein [Puia sp.]
ALVRNRRFVVHYKQSLYVETLLMPSARSIRDYAILTATTGQNRKAVVAEGQGNRVGSFLKIALNKSSVENIASEYKSLCLLGGIPFKSTVIPKAWKINEQVIRVSNSKLVTARKQPEFGQAHCRFLWDMYDASFERKYYRQLEISRETRERLLRLASNPKLREKGEARELFYKLKFWEDQLQTTNPMVATAVCHGNFTPQTVRSGGSSLFVFDWELSRPTMPVLFDLFHYVIQESGLTGNGAVKGLQARLDLLLNSPIPAWFLRERGLDPTLYLRLYLLYHSSYCLETYLKQEMRYEKGCQLLSIWSNLLGKVDSKQNELPNPIPDCKSDFPEAKIIRIEDFGLSSTFPYLINSRI